MKIRRFKLQQTTFMQIASNMRNALIIDMSERKDWKEGDVIHFEEDLPKGGRSLLADLHSMVKGGKDGEQGIHGGHALIQFAVFKSYAAADQPATQSPSLVH